MDSHKLTVVLLQVRELFGVKRLCLANKADTVERQGDVVGFGQLAFTLQVLEQALANSRMGAVSTNENVAMDGGVV